MYGIYANIWGILMVNVTIYSSTMDPMGNGSFWPFFYRISYETNVASAQQWAASGPNQILRVLFVAL